MRAFHEQLAPQGVTFRQAQVLGWLAQAGPLSQAELATRMLIEPASLVGVLDRMQRDGWIERQPCPDDKRKKLVAARPAATRVWKKIAATGRAIRSTATAGMTANEIETLRDLLARVQENVQHYELAAVGCDGRD